MHRFFLPGTAIVPGQPVDLSPISHQLSRVLRLKPGDQIVLLDGADSEYPTQITAMARHQASGNVLSHRQVNTEPTAHLTLYQCSLKGDKFEWVLQKGTELGVSAFAPVISERCVVKPAKALLKKYERWRTIIREAAEQSGRGQLPFLHKPLSFVDALEHAGGSRFLPWEDADRQNTPLSLGEAVTLQCDNTKAVSLLVGPEGGLTVDEVTQASRVGWHVVTLGSRILRAETAALASLTITLERLSEFRA